jgi:hypothetical protein
MKGGMDWDHRMAVALARKGNVMEALAELRAGYPDMAALSESKLRRFKKTPGGKRQIAECRQSLEAVWEEVISGRATGRAIGHPVELATVLAEVRSIRADIACMTSAILTMTAEQIERSSREETAAPKTAVIAALNGGSEHA